MLYNNYLKRKTYIFCGDKYFKMTEFNITINLPTEPPPAPEAEGRPHSIIERPGRDGQYTTHNPENKGGWLQYRGSGKGHGEMDRPNVKYPVLNDKAPPELGPKYDIRVRRPNPDEYPK